MIQSINQILLILFRCDGGWYYWVLKDDLSGFSLTCLQFGFLFRLIWFLGLIRRRGWKWLSNHLPGFRLPFIEFSCVVRTRWYLWKFLIQLLEDDINRKIQFCDLYDKINISTCVEQLFLLLIGYLLDGILILFITQHL